MFLGGPSGLYDLPLSDQVEALGYALARLDADMALWSLASPTQRDHVVLRGGGRSKRKAATFSGWGE